MHTRLSDDDNTLVGVQIFGSPAPTTVVIDTAADRCTIGTTAYDLGEWRPIELLLADRELVHTEAFTLPAAHTMPATAAFASRYRFANTSLLSLRDRLRRHSQRYEGFFAIDAP